MFAQSITQVYLFVFKAINLNFPQQIMMKIGDQSLLLYHYICISANHLITGNIFYIPVSKNISMKRSLVLFQTSRGYHFSVQGLLLFSILCVYFCHEILGNFLKSSKILDGLVGLRDSITPAMKRAFILRKRCPKLGSKKTCFYRDRQKFFQKCIFKLLQYTYVLSMGQ